MRYLIETQLKMFGYKDFTLAKSGEEALALFEHKQFDLVLLDWRLATMEGIEVLRIIKSKPELKNMAVVMLTVEKSREKVKEAIENGADGYLLKPLQADKLKDSIDKLKQKYKFGENGANPASDFLVQ